MELVEQKDRSKDSEKMDKPDSWLWPWKWLFSGISAKPAKYLKVRAAAKKSLPMARDQFPPILVLGDPTGDECGTECIERSCPCDCRTSSSLDECIPMGGNVADSWPGPTSLVLDEGPRSLED